MPGESFYDGLSLTDQLTKFIDHHHDPHTRHISGFESKMLDKARNALSTASESDRSATAAGGIVLASCGLVALAGLGVIGRNRYLARRREDNGDGHQSATSEPPSSGPPDVEAP